MGSGALASPGHDADLSGLSPSCDAWLRARHIDRLVRTLIDQDVDVGPGDHQIGPSSYQLADETEPEALERPPFPHSSGGATLLPEAMCAISRGCAPDLVYP